MQTLFKRCFYVVFFFPIKVFEIWSVSHSKRPSQREVDTFPKLNSHTRLLSSMTGSGGPTVDSTSTNTAALLNTEAQTSQRLPVLTGATRVFLNPPSIKEYFKPKTAASFVCTVIPSDMKDGVLRHTETIN